jgi:hypothetical protein
VIASRTGRAGTVIAKRPFASAVARTEPASTIAPASGDFAGAARISPLSVTDCRRGVAAALNPASSTRTSATMASMVSL